MKKFEVLVTTKAFSDMADIQRYIEDELLQPRIAENLLGNLEKSIFSLEFMPLKHPVVGDSYLADRGIPKLPVENYLGFYIVSEPDSKVYIFWVIYGKRNWINLLNANGM